MPKKHIDVARFNEHSYMKEFKDGKVLPSKVFEFAGANPKKKEVIFTSSEGGINDSDIQMFKVANHSLPTEVHGNLLVATEISGKQFAIFQGNPF